jgi:hypothetical protein
MSSGYNLAYDYAYLNRIKKKILEDEKNYPYWEPKTESEKRSMVGRGNPPVGAEKRNVGFNNYSKFNTFYERTPKAYKSSGNEGYYYYHQNELDNINKMKMPQINYEKRDYDNANKKMSKDDLEIYDSIFEAVDNDFDMDQLKGYGRKNLSPHEKTVLNLILRNARNVKKLEGGISKKSFKKALKVSVPIARKVAATGVRIGLPAIAAVAAPELGIPPPVAAAITNVAAKELAKKIGGFKALNPVSKVSLLDKKVGGEMSREQKEKIAKNVIKTFGAVALAGATKYILPKVVKYLGDKYGVSPELARELFGVARFLIEATVSHNIRGAGCKDDDSDDGSDVGYICNMKGSGLKDQEKYVYDVLNKSLQKHMKGGKFDISNFKEEAFKKSLKFGKKAAPVIAKASVPIVTKAIGDQLGLPPTVSKTVGKVLGDLASKALSGKGKDKGKERVKIVKRDVGVYKGGQSKQKNRAALVKKIMQEKGMSLPQASKHIKENNIPY